MPAPIDKKAIWLAGFCDGEGAIMISKWIRHDTLSQNPQYQLRLSIVNTDLPTLEYIKREFGGALREGHGTNKPSRMITKSFKPVYEWLGTDKTAFTVLKRIAPYLVLKRERALLALSYQKSRYEWQELNNGDRRLTTEEIARRELIWQKMKTLNHKGVKHG